MNEKRREIGSLYCPKIVPVFADEFFDAVDAVADRG